MEGLDIKAMPWSGRDAMVDVRDVNFVAKFPSFHPPRPLPFFDTVQSAPHPSNATPTFPIPAARSRAQMPGARRGIPPCIPPRVNSPMKLAGASLPRRYQSVASARPAFVTSSPRSLASITSSSQHETPTTSGGTPPQSRAQCISTNPPHTSLFLLIRHGTPLFYIHSFTRLDGCSVKHIPYCLH